MVVVRVRTNHVNGNGTVLATVTFERGTVAISSPIPLVREEMLNRGVYDAESARRYLPKDGEMFLKALLKTCNRGFLKCEVLRTH